MLWPIEIAPHRASVAGQYGLRVGRAAAGGRAVQRAVRRDAARIRRRRARAQADELAVIQPGDRRRRQNLLFEPRVLLARAVSPGHRRVAAPAIDPALALAPLEGGLIYRHLLGVLFQKSGQAGIVAAVGLRAAFERILVDPPELAELARFAQLREFLIERG